mmetsp:Transcript_31832/g.83416  ORF Transcript_31832/g.83416 Transcript_31832/m.83416 type:complete len:253 (-) Transcript_31832:651-1409(-)
MDSLEHRVEHCARTLSSHDLLLQLQQVGKRVVGPPLEKCSRDRSVRLERPVLRLEPPELGHELLEISKALGAVPLIVARPERPRGPRQRRPDLGKVAVLYLFKDLVEVAQAAVQRHAGRWLALWWRLDDVGSKESGPSINAPRLVYHPGIRELVQEWRHKINRAINDDRPVKRGGLCTVLSDDSLCRCDQAAHLCRAATDSVNRRWQGAGSSGQPADGLGGNAAVPATSSVLAKAPVEKVWSRHHQHVRSAR